MRTTLFLTAEKKPRALTTLIFAAFMTIGPFSQAARPNDNAASQSFWCRAGLDADQSLARPRGSCFCWQAELKINDRTSASLRPQDVTNIWGIRPQSRGAS